MGPRDEDNSLLLLGATGLICGLIAFVPSLLEPAPAVANNSINHLAYQKPERISHPAPIASSTLVPARVIVPFTPNTMPAER